MKTTFLNTTKAIFLMLFISLNITSCASDDSKPSQDLISNENVFSVLINGGQYTPSNVNLMTSSVTNGSSTIVTFKENGEGINISIPSDEIGTYTVADGVYDDFILSYVRSDSDFFVSTSGTLTITEKLQIDETTKRIKGNFSFSLVDTNNSIVYELTEGSFDIEYLSF